ncbi:MAG: hypothetical protein H6Q10_2201, partial [Acidobacteria bacterium]|nr:hypothetical protein [Acidobacteriota bacterium]
LRFMIDDAGLVDRAAPLVGLEYGF